MANESGTWIMREATSQMESSLSDLATAATEKRSFEVYGVDWDDPWQKIVNHMHEIYPIATDKQIKKALK